MYDYLVVGAGLYGAIFAHEAKKANKSVLVLEKRPNIAGNVYTEKIELMFISMGHIFFIQIMRTFGIMLENLLSLIVLQIVLLQIIKVNYIRCHLICIPLIRCGEL